MISVCPTQDVDLLRRIIRDPHVYPLVSDDGSPAAAEYDPVIHPSVIYLLVSRDEEPIGCFIFTRANFATAEVHTCLLPIAWGGIAKEAARRAMAWLWANTGYHRLITHVPVSNRLALKFALKSGLVEFGRDPASFMKDGVLHDQILLGISRGAA